MKIINADYLFGTDKEVKFTGGTSLRAVVESDGLGFSVAKTIIEKGGPYLWHYDKHLEACYCISGFGVLTDSWTGETFDIMPGIVYLQDKNEEHTFEALRDTVLISIFNPPLKGKETHDKNGNYGI